MRVLCVAGARPNFMKVKPVADALERRGADVLLVHTGQHYDAALSATFFDDLGLRAPDRDLGVGSGAHAQQTAGVMTAFEPVLHDLAPDAVVVVGDVNSTLACALVAAKAGARLAHVEAGLRSFDRSMPEEVNRVVVDRLADDLFAPSPDAVDNLLAEGAPPERVHLVGNVMVDTLLANLDRARARPVLDELGLAPAVTAWSRSTGRRTSTTRPSSRASSTRWGTWPPTSRWSSPRTRGRAPPSATASCRQACASWTPSATSTRSRSRRALASS